MENKYNYAVFNGFDLDIQKGMSNLETLLEVFESDCRMYSQKFVPRADLIVDRKKFHREIADSLKFWGMIKDKEGNPIKPLKDDEIGFVISAMEEYLYGLYNMYECSANESLRNSEAEKELESCFAMINQNKLLRIYANLLTFAENKVYAIVPVFKRVDKDFKLMNLVTPDRNLLHDLKSGLCIDGMTLSKTE